MNTAGSTRVGARGQATVEVALVLPVVVLLALAVGQVAVIGVDSVLVHHAAREAARAAAVEPAAGVARSAATGAAGLDSERLEVSLSGGRSRGDSLTVKVTYTSATNMPLVGRFVGDVELASEVTIRVE
ncbi:MAG: TadE/TadG family type IV pilus assembly protein [Acidimicrobiales bacterium]